MSKFKKEIAKNVAKFLLSFIVFLAFFAVYNLARAAYYNLPEPIVGDVTVTDSQTGNHRYGGFTGNEAIFNYDPSEPLLGFDSGGLMSCYLLGIEEVNKNINNPYCYRLNQTGVMNILTGQTYLNGMAATETAALLWPGNSIVGDAYSNSSYLNNFAFYGRNLNQSRSPNPPGTGYTWGTGSYTLNKEAQASYDGSQRAYFDSRITLLNGEGQQISVANLTNATSWRLQNGSTVIDQNNTASAASYPEGKVWSVEPGNVILARTITYHDKGTIIINGDLTLNPDVSIVPQSNNDFLGIIVKGKLTFSGRNKAQMANFTTGNIIISANYVDAIGSYAAQNFSVNNRSGIRFYYDFRLDSFWPPGFRYFNMPTTKNTAP